MENINREEEKGYTIADCFMCKYFRATGRPDRTAPGACSFKDSFIEVDGYNPPCKNFKPGKLPHNTILVF